MNDYLVKRLSALALAACIFSPAVLAATTEFLGPDDIVDASDVILLEDVKMFNTIGIGIAMSIAQCEGQDVCDAIVDEHEIRRLIDVLNQRIDSVLYRQQNNEEELAAIVVAYADTKATYQGYIEKLNQIEILPDPDDLSDDPFADDDVFKDSDEDLLDDEDGLGEFELPEIFEEAAMEGPAELEGPAGSEDPAGSEEPAGSEDPDSSEGSEDSEPGSEP